MHLTSGAEPTQKNELAATVGKAGQKPKGLMSRWNLKFKPKKLCMME
jgi:hypothetical protein